MGMDAVELIIRTEEEFNISILDEEAEHAVTVGDLYNIVLSKVDVTPGCMTSKAFYFTRRALIKTFGLPRKAIHPTTPLAPMMPEAIRRRQWHELSETLALPLPKLRMIDSLEQRLYRTAMFLALTPIACLLYFSSRSSASLTFALVIASIFLWFAFFMLLSWLLIRIFRWKALDLPADNAGELARIVLGLNQTAFTSEESYKPWTSDAVWEKLVDIIVDQLQIERSEVVPNAKFGDDLGVC